MIRNERAMHPIQNRIFRTLALGLVLALPLGAQETGSGGRDFSQASGDLQRQLEESLAELARLREQVAAEQIPLSRRLGELEAELSRARQEYQQTTRLLDSRTLDLSNLRSEIKIRDEEASYLATLFGQFVRDFESRLHISELARHQGVVEEAKLAPENSNLSQEQVYAAQVALVEASMERLQDALGGTRFEGSAVDANGLVKKGSFVLIGPVALFRSEDGTQVGAAEQRLGSLQPTVIPYMKPEDRLAADELVRTSAGLLPLDPSLGNASKVEATSETVLEHIQKGGPVMVPILVLAGAALLVVLVKWLSMAFVRTPSAARLRPLLEAVGRRDREGAQREAAALKGPAGAMLAAGAAHLEEPRELIEEVMYETVLATRLRLNRWLPFVAISASSAPLLGLLGTVTGIMNTFTLITVFGTGDVKTLSGGISEALITTEYGLIVAIPSLLLHGFLSRKAKGVVDQMEKSAVSFLNQVAKAQSEPVVTVAPAPVAETPAPVPPRPEKVGSKV